MTLRNTLIATAFCIYALMAAPAQAGAIIDVYDPTDVFLGHNPANATAACTGANPDHTATGDTATNPTTASACMSLEYMHNITPEFSGAPQTLSSALLTLYFRDNESLTGDGPSESYALLLDGFSAGGQILTQNSLSNFGYDAALRMSADGQLLVTIIRAGAESSDFFFEGSTLSATWDDAQELQELVATPEPASMILLGTGLAGVAARLRRRPTRA